MGSFVRELIRKILQYHLDERDPYWENIKFMAEHGMLPDSFCESLLYQVDSAIQMQHDYPNYLHRPPTSEQFYAKGRPHVRLGSLAEDPSLAFGIRFDGPVFVLVSGVTGFGKTIATRVLLREIYRYNLRYPQKKVVVFVFDRKGGDYADLPAIFGWKHFHVYDSIRLALECPRGMPPQTWINIVSNIFCARTGLKYSWVTLASALRRLLGLLNPKPSRRLIWPDFQLVLDFLNSLPATQFSSKAEYTRSLTQPLTGISESSFKTFSAFQGFRIEDLIAAGQSAVIAMPNMEPSWMRQLFVDVLVSQVLKGRIERSERLDSTRVLFVVEEADSDVDARTELMFSDMMSPLSECFKRGREFGVGGMVIVSSLLTVSQLIKENATTHIMFRMGDSRARAEAARTLMLPPYGELIFSHLAEGECLVKQAGPWPHAAKGKIDNMAPSRVRITQYDKHPYMPSRRLWQIPELQQAVSDLKSKKEKAKNRRASDKDADLEQLALRLLRHGTSNPYVPVARLFEKVGKIRHKKQIAVREFLKDKSYALFEEPRIGSKNMLLMEITAKGYNACNIPVPEGNKGRGSISHRHFANWVKSLYEKQGHKAFLEWLVPGTNHPVDVAVERDNHWHVFEICVTSPDNLVSHIKACFEDSTAVRSLTVVAGTKVETKQLETLVLSQLNMATYIENIRFESIEKYIQREAQP